MTLTTSAPQYQAYVAEMRKIADLRYASAVLKWDQETYLPEKGAAIRTQQIATLSTMAHELFTHEKMGALIENLRSLATLSATEKNNVERSWEDYQRNTLFEASFIHELTMTTHEAFHAWVKARENNNFKLFSPALKKIVLLKQKEAGILGYKDHPYNALLNDHDKGATVALCDTIFNNLKKPLHDLIQEVKAKHEPPAFMNAFMEKTQQWDAGIDLLKKMGYDFGAGRQDLSAHPFTVNFNARDVRITTRVDEHDFSNMLWSSIHELGHALYEQGLPIEQYGLPLGEPASYSIHESQSRLWENHVGRSKAFCDFLLPHLRFYFPTVFKEVETDHFYEAINRVSPSFIRTEADELTYHFHIMIRYELEKLLITGELQVEDIPAYWNEAYKKYLEIDVPGDDQGCLQDVHWSHGSFGYFPTYSIGSFYAAQFHHFAEKSVENLNQHISQGEFEPLLLWLNKEIHCYGRQYTSEEICRQVTGEGLNIAYFLDYARQKFSNLKS
jgi:carboxypeptidase Taq